MSHNHPCERCGQPVPGAASEDICPRCLAQLGQAAWLGESATEASVAVSVDGNLFGGGSVRLFDLSSQEPTLLGTLPDSGNRMAFTSDGELIVTASAERIKVWEVESRTPIRAFQPLGRGGVSSIAISPDNRLIATTEFWHHAIRLIDFETGQTETVLRGHTAMVWTAIFSPDGSYLASGSSDQTVRLWDVASRAPRERMVGHESEIWSLAFSPSGETLWSGSKDKTVAVQSHRRLARHVDGGTRRLQHRDGGNRVRNRIHAMKSGRESLRFRLLWMGPSCGAEITGRNSAGRIQCGDMRIIPWWMGNA